MFGKKKINEDNPPKVTSAMVAGITFGNIIGGAAMAAIMPLSDFASLSDSFSSENAEDLFNALEKMDILDSAGESKFGITMLEDGAKEPFTGKTFTGGEIGLPEGHEHYNTRIHVNPSNGIIDPNIKLNPDQSMAYGKFSGEMSGLNKGGQQISYFAGGVGGGVAGAVLGTGRGIKKKKEWKEEVKAQKENSKKGWFFR